jgi:hypothetical protein
MNRRTFITTTTTLATAGLAGCSSMDSGDNKAGGQPTKTLTAEGEKKAKRLTFGETLTLPRVSITLSNPRAMKKYRWSEDGEESVAKAGEGKQWLVVHARAENTRDRKVRLPLTENFKGIVGDRLFHPGRNKSPSEKYIGGKVPPGRTHEGDVAYLVPEDVSVDRFRVLYKERRPSGKHRVWWER